MVLLTRGQSASVTGVRVADGLGMTVVVRVVVKAVGDGLEELAATRDSLGGC